MKVNDVINKHLAEDKHRYSELYTIDRFLRAPSESIEIGIHWLCFYYIKKG